VRHSPAEDLLATVGRDGVVHLREPDSGTSRSTFGGSTGRVQALRGPAQGPWFSTNGALLLTGFDGSVRLWDAELGEQIGQPFPNDPGVRAGGAEGSPLQLATASGDHVLIWNLDIDSWFRIACRAAGSNLTLAEWEQFGPTDTTHQPTCPDQPGQIQGSKQ